MLGPLGDIDQLTAAGPVKSPRTWLLRSDQHSFPAVLHAQAGATVEVPYPGAGDRTTARANCRCWNCVPASRVADRLRRR